MKDKTIRPSWMYSSGRACDVFVVTLGLFIVYSFSLGYYVWNYVDQISEGTFHALQVSFWILFIIALIPTVWFFSSRILSKKKVGLLGSVVRYDYRDKNSNMVYTNFRIHLDNSKGLWKLRSMPHGIRELQFALEFLYVLRAIRDGISEEWPTPTKIKATSFKLKERSAITQGLGFPLQKIGPGFSKWSNAFLSAFVEHPTPKGWVTFIKNLSSPLYTFTISYQDLNNMDLDVQIERFEQALTRRNKGRYAQK
ncbi:hypothetical protein [Paenibacillus taichungensis]